MDEAELIRRCVNKEPLAWAEFIRRYSPLIHWAIQDRLKKWGYFHRPEDTEEIHQNVFLSLWGKDKLAQLKDYKKVAPWLVVISGNEAVDYFRRKKSQTPPNAVSIFEEIAQKGNTTITLADILPCPVNDSVSDEESDETKRLLTEELESLTAREKIIIKLNVLYGKKYREISEMLNMPLGSVATAIKNIKHNLKRRITEKIKNSKIKQPVLASYIVGAENE